MLLVSHQTSARPAIPTNWESFGGILQCEIMTWLAKQFQAKGATAVKQLGWKKRVNTGRIPESSPLDPIFPCLVVSAQDFPHKRSQWPPCARLSYLFLLYLNISPSKSSTTVNYVIRGHRSSDNISSTSSASETSCGSNCLPAHPERQQLLPSFQINSTGQRGRGRQQEWEDGYGLQPDWIRQHSSER